jgi:hypothetical protein
MASEKARKRFKLELNCKTNKFASNNHQNTKTLQMQ